MNNKTLSSPPGHEYYRWIHSTLANHIQNPNNLLGLLHVHVLINPCAIFIDLNIALVSFWRGKASVFFSNPSALVRLYQCVQHRRQYLSKFINTCSKIVSLCQSFSAPSELISNCLSLSARTVQSGSLCQTFSVMAVQYQYLSKFVSEKGESQYFSDPVVNVVGNFI